jgi:hypothetical protein
MSKTPYKSFNLYFQLEDSKDLIFYNDVNIENIGNSKIDLKEFERISSQNKDDYNIYYISKTKQNNDYTWISDDYSADIVILKSSNFNFFKNDSFYNVILVVDDESYFEQSMRHLYKNARGFIDFKIKNSFNKELLVQQFKGVSDFIIDEIKNGLYTEVKQLNKFFNEEKYDSFGENSVFIAPNFNVYRHPIAYWHNTKRFVPIQEFKFNEEFVHFSKPHIVCHNCETFYCDRNIYFNFKETTEWKVPAFTECRKTTFISMFQKHIFNRIQDEISLNEYEPLDKLGKEFNAEKEYLILVEGLSLVNKIKGFNPNYVRDSGELSKWEYSFKK